MLEMPMPSWGRQQNIWHSFSSVLQPACPAHSAAFLESWQQIALLAWHDHDLLPCLCVIVRWVWSMRHIQSNRLLHHWPTVPWSFFDCCPGEFVVVDIPTVPQWRQSWSCPDVETRRDYLQEQRPCLLIFYGRQTLIQQTMPNLCCWPLLLWQSRPARPWSALIF